MLPVHKRIVFLTILVGMRQRYLDVVACQMNHRVERIFGHVGLEQVEQTVARDIALTVEPDGQPGVEVGVIAHQRCDKLLIIMVIVENRVVRGKLHERTVLLAARFVIGLHQQFSAGKFSPAHQPVTHASDDE